MDLLIYVCLYHDDNDNDDDEGRYKTLEKM